jgi:phage gpG-like protein
VILYSRFQNTQGILELQNYLSFVAGNTRDAKAIKVAISNWIRSDVTRALKRNAAGGVLNSKSGALRRAVYATPVTTRQGLAIEIRAPRVPYAAIHEVGGVIQPRNGKYLAVPISGGPADKKFFGGFQPRKFENTFIFPRLSSGGNMLVFQRIGRRIVPLWTLLDQVEIPPREWMSKSIDEALPTLWPQIRADMLV